MRAMIVVASAVLSACATEVHTLENTRDLTQSELVALCRDLQMRAEQDCRWNIEEQQSSISNQQTWEINCRARRESARTSFSNVCLPALLPASTETG